MLFYNIQNKTIKMDENHTLRKFFRGKEIDFDEIKQKLKEESSTMSQDHITKYKNVLSILEDYNKESLFVGGAFIPYPDGVHSTLVPSYPINTSAEVRFLKRQKEALENDDEGLLNQRIIAEGIECIRLIKNK